MRCYLWRAYPDGASGFGSLIVRSFNLSLIRARATYFAARIVLGDRRWAAAILAIVYLTCLGILAFAYDSDLYMSWMTVPWVPVAFLAVYRNAIKPRWSSTLILAVGLCW